MHCSRRGPKFNSHWCRLAYNYRSGDQISTYVLYRQLHPTHTWPHIGTYLHIQLKIKAIIFKVIFYYWLYVTKKWLDYQLWISFAISSFYYCWTIIRLQKYIWWALTEMIKSVIYLTCSWGRDSEVPVRIFFFFQFCCTETWM